MAPKLLNTSEFGESLRLNRLAVCDSRQQERFLLPARSQHPPIVAGQFEDAPSDEGEVEEAHKFPPIAMALLNPQLEQRATTPSPQLAARKQAAKTTDSPATPQTHETDRTAPSQRFFPALSWTLLPAYIPPAIVLPANASLPNLGHPQQGRGKARTRGRKKKQLVPRVSLRRRPNPVLLANCFQSGPVLLAPRPSRASHDKTNNTRTVGGGEVDAGVFTTTTVATPPLHHRGSVGGNSSSFTSLQHPQLQHTQSRIALLEGATTLAMFARSDDSTSTTPRGAASPQLCKNNTRDDSTHHKSRRRKRRCLPLALAGTCKDATSGDKHEEEEDDDDKEEATPLKRQRRMGGSTGHNNDVSPSAVYTQIPGISHHPSNLLIPTTTSLPQAVQPPLSKMGTQQEPIDFTQTAVHIQEPSELDVLLGRGSGTYHHIGNRAFRRLVASYRPAYTTLPKGIKTLLAHNLVDFVRKNGGRFLCRGDDENGGWWYECGDERAVQKVRQSLREVLPGEAFQGSSFPPPATKPFGKGA